MNLAVPLRNYVEQAGDFRKAMEKLKEDGFSTASVSFIDGVEPFKLHALEMKDSGLMFDIHSNHVDTNLASYNEGIRKESVRQLKEEILFTKSIDCKLITFHPGRYRNFLYERAAYDALYKSLDETLPFALTQSVMLCMENQENREKEICKSAENLRYVLGKFPLWLTLDAAHCAMNNLNPVEVYREFRSRIKVIHLSGFRPGRSHVEVPLSQSEYDFTDFIREIQDFKGIVRVENRSTEQVNESVAFIRKITNQ